MNIDNYDKRELPPLSAQEEQKSYAHYYYEGRTEVTDKEILDAIRPGNPMSVEKAMYPEDLKKVLDPDFEQPQIGYCMLPEGIAYACMCTKMPDCTIEMENWFMPWVYGDPGLRYKIWYPGFHECHYHNLAVEDIGLGMADLLQGERPSFEELGFEGDPHEKNPKILKVMGRNARMRLHTEDLNAQKGFSCMVHVLRDYNGGMERWSFGWTGGHIQGGKLVNKVAPDEVITEEHGRCMAHHLAYEYARQAYLLPKLYAEYSSEPLSGNKPEWPERITKYLK